jgi:ubiquinone/menaquinone biosynthesis C-methylase UbiE
MIKKFNKDYFKYLFPQRTRLMTEYALNQDSDNDFICEQIGKMVEKDYDMIKSYLPQTADSILDIGCGLGLIDLALYNHYNGELEVNLLDKTKDLDEGENIRGFNGKKYTFYNSLDASLSTLSDNGVDTDKIKCYEVDSHSDLFNKKYDIIVSLLSCGWHYSIELYKDLIQSTLKPEGTLILDIRHNTDQLDYAKEHFELVDHIINSAESRHDGGTVGDRYIFKLK